MALILLAGAGYAYYQQQEARFRLDEGIDLDAEGVQSLEFLKAEVSTTILQSTLSTISFYEGLSAATIAPLLQRRVEAIRQANPWLGGMVAQKRSEAQPKLYWGTSSVTTPSSFQTFELGQIPFTSHTPYHQMEDLMRDYKVKVPTLPEVMGSSKHPLWKVTLIPDAAEPDNKFALIVSLAHVLGDAHTFYQIYHMLGDLDRNENDDMIVEELSVTRIPEYHAEVQARLGVEESTFFQAANPALWERNRGGKQNEPQKKHKGHEVILFTIQPEWLEKQRQAGIEAAVGACGNDHDNDNNNNNNNNNSSSSSNSNGIELQELAHSLSNEAIIVSWFFRDVVQPTIGLVAKSDLRNFCSSLGELDAGNYIAPIPLVGPVDYGLAVLVQQALGSGKRSGKIIVPAAVPDPNAVAAHSTEGQQQPSVAKSPTTTSIANTMSAETMIGTKLPNRILMAGPNTVFGLGVDWTRLLPQGELRLLSGRGGAGSARNSSGGTVLQQGWHWPLHDTLDLDCLSPRVSALLLFAAQNGTLGASCIVSSANDKEMSQRIIASGIIQETIGVL